ncbi:hypothetical protein JCM8115_003062 [Rhodotorula mucilaginosa]
MSKLLGYLPPPVPLLIDVLNLKNPVNALLLALVVVLTLRILLPPPPYVPTPYGLADNPDEAYNWRPRRHPESQLWRTWTPQELQKYDGTDPNHEGGKILFAIRRKVYDVTAGKSFYGPGGPYATFAGRDASRGLAKQSFEADMLSPLDQPIDNLSDLTESEWKNLRDWESHFETKYTKCGDYVEPR